MNSDHSLHNYAELFDCLDAEINDDLSLLRKAYAAKLKTIDQRQDIEGFQLIKQAFTRLQKVLRSLQPSADKAHNVIGIASQLNTFSLGVEEQQENTLARELQKKTTIKFTSECDNKTLNIGDMKSDEDSFDNNKHVKKDAWLDDNSLPTKNTLINEEQLLDNPFAEEKEEIDSEVVKKEFTQRYGIELEDAEYVTQAYRSPEEIKKRFVHQDKINEIMSNLHQCYSLVSTRYDARKFDTILRDIQHTHFYYDEKLALLKAIKAFFSIRPFVDRRVLKTFKQAFYQWDLPQQWHDFIAEVFAPPEDKISHYYLRNHLLEDIWQFPSQAEISFYIQANRPAEGAELLLCLLMELELSQRTGLPMRDEILGLVGQQLSRLKFYPMAVLHMALLLRFSASHEDRHVEFSDRLLHILKAQEKSGNNAANGITAAIERLQQLPFYYDLQSFDDDKTDDDLHQLLAQYPPQPLDESVNSAFDLIPASYACIFNEAAFPYHHSERSRRFTDFYQSLIHHSHGEVSSADEAFFSGIYEFISCYLERLSHRVSRLYCDQQEAIKIQQLQDAREQQAQVDQQHKIEALAAKEVEKRLQQQAEQEEQQQQKKTDVLPQQLAFLMLDADMDALIHTLAPLMEEPDARTAVIEVMNKHLFRTPLTLAQKIQLLQLILPACESDELVESEGEFLEAVTLMALTLLPEAAPALFDKLKAQNPQRQALLEIKQQYYKQAYMDICSAEEPDSNDFEARFYYAFSHQLCGQMERAEVLFDELDMKHYSLSFCYVDLLLPMVDALGDLQPILKDIAVEIRKL